MTAIISSYLSLPTVKKLLLVFQNLETFFVLQRSSSELKMGPNALEVNDQLFHVISSLSLFINRSRTLKIGIST